ncbi:hypothetical protein BKA93DRAFT_726517 [Sparassis latifolia]|uniref:Uncharacterized protein n=1 Tax=Sparassis crispa TaxID=139825 RepID=A0A401GKE6_9APHY|nr:hypothetical protein SCP_0410210 [Sparassis crispa]GBE82636.1 hypothetical protein SCP_0410210 [Sparassis crispa]
MQAFRGFSRVCHRQLCYDLARRSLSTASGPSEPNVSVPWFMDPSEVSNPPTASSVHRPTPPHLRPSSLEPLAPLPATIPADSHIVHLHAALRTSPHLEPGTLLVREPVPTSVGPPLPDAMPKGRRKRGRTYAGEPVYDYDGGIWNWVVIAQVKEGTENRGAIESVVRVVRKVLLTAQPPVLLPHNTKKRMSDGWAMLDAGDFAVHIVSKDAREKFFPDSRREWSTS